MKTKSGQVQYTLYPPRWQVALMKKNQKIILLKCSGQIYPLDVLLIFEIQGHSRWSLWRRPIALLLAVKVVNFPVSVNKGQCRPSPFAIERKNILTMAVRSTCCLLAQFVDYFDNVVPHLTDRRTLQLWILNRNIVAVLYSYGCKHNLLVEKMSCY